MALDIEPPVHSPPDANPPAGRHGAGVAILLQGLRRVASNLGVIAIFSLPALFLWWRAWAGGPASTVRCNCLDPAQQVWFIAWPAYAISHGLDPLFSNWLWAPHGVNLLDNASGPLVGILLSPLTWLVGPFAATTVALTLAPGLSGWGCWIASRRFTTWPPAAWFAGFLFGYSPVVVENVSQGHLSVGLLVVPPLALAVLHELFVRRRRSPTWCGTALGVLVFVQFLISAEVLTVTAISAALGIAVAAAASPRRAAELASRTVRALCVAAVVAIVLVSPAAWEMLKGPQHITGALWSGLQALFTARLYALWSPGTFRSVLWAGALAGPAGEFLGAGVIVLAGVSLAVTARRRTTWVIAATGALATLFSWGGLIWFSAGHFVVSSWLPWGHVVGLPLLQNVSPKTFAVIGQLAVAVVIGMGLDAIRWSALGERMRPAVRAGATAAAAALAALPIWLTYAAPLAVQHVDLPPWYATAGRAVHSGSVIVSYPFPASASATAQPMVWQAADGMRFRLAGGYVKVPAPRGQEGVIGLGPPNSATRTLDQLTYLLPAAGRFQLTPEALLQLRSALESWHTSYVVVVDRGLAVTAAAMFTAATGQAPVVSHRAWVWDLRDRPLESTYNPSASLEAFDECTQLGRRTVGLGAVHGPSPLPQTINRCILARAQPQGEPLVVARGPTRTGAI